MKFDIKDIKTWANRHDVKAGDVGYVTCDFNTFLLTTKVALVTKATVKDIDDNDSRCFLAQPLDGKVVFHYGFYLPVDAVKEDKPKKKYRPFKNLYEFYKFLSYDNFTEEEFTQNMLLGEVFTYREKKAPRYAHTTVITKINFDLADDPCEPNIEGRNLEMWFDRFEIRNDDLEWQPFGVEVQDE